MFQSVKTKIFFCLVLFLALPLFVFADFGGQQTSFFINSSYDLFGRAQLTATLLRITPSLYFYLDDQWWGSLDATSQQEAKMALQVLGEEFENKIYPTLAASFGSEWKPGIDGDAHITVLLHPMQDYTGGYVNTGDEYPRIQSPFSNQRELIYFNTKNLTSSLAKSFLAHEFVHLITFNQKENKTGTPEDIWLNEVRAEYVSTLLGYDSDFQQSNLKKRVELFLQYPNDSLTEWQGLRSDYGVANLFGQYLVGRYGLKILSDSLKSEKVGIASLNEAMKKNGFSEDFSEVFTNWTIANFLNNCAISKKYCYENPGLATIKITPSINFLPLKGNSTLAITQETKNWQGNWQRFIGGRGDLKIEFAGFPDLSFKVPYVLQYRKGGEEVGFLELDSSQRGKLVLNDFGGAITSLTIIPSLQGKTSNFSLKEKSYPFFWSVSTAVSDSSAEPGQEQAEENTQTQDIQVLLGKIEFLEKQLAILQKQLKEAMGVEEPTTAEQTLTKSLRQGDRGDEVRLLQAWLAKDPSVYPEALVTGYFGPLTKAAVKRFQEKYSSEILSPWGLLQGTGFVGSTTRAKLNQLNQLQSRE